MSGVTLDWLKALTWLCAIGIGLLVAFLGRRRFDLAALASVAVLMVTNAGAGIYVLNHVGDHRWASRAEDRLSAPPLRETPVIGDFLEPLDSLMGGVVDSVNKVVDFQAALPVAMEFFVAAGWAFIVSLPLSLVALVVGYAVARRRRAEFRSYKLRVDDLTEELADIRRHLGYPARSAPDSAR